MENTNLPNIFMFLKVRDQNASPFATTMRLVSTTLMKTKLKMVTVSVGSFTVPLILPPNGQDNVPIQQKKPKPALHKNQRKINAPGVVEGRVSSFVQGKKELLRSKPLNMLSALVSSMLKISRFLTAMNRPLMMPLRSLLKLFRLLKMQFHSHNKRLRQRRQVNKRAATLVAVPP